MQHQVLHANPHTADRDDVTLWRQQKDDQRRVKLRGGYAHRVERIELAEAS
jgi:hypothetical protein